MEQTVTIDGAYARAASKRLRKALLSSGSVRTLSACQDLVARAVGLRSWREVAAVAGRAQTIAADAPTRLATALTATGLARAPAEAAAAATFGRRRGRGSDADAAEPPCAWSPRSDLGTPLLAGRPASFEVALRDDLVEEVRLGRPEVLVRALAVAALCPEHRFRFVTGSRTLLDALLGGSDVGSLRRRRIDLRAEVSDVMSDPWMMTSGDEAETAQARLDAVADGSRWPLATWPLRNVSWKVDEAAIAAAGPATVGYDPARGVAEGWILAACRGFCAQVGGEVQLHALGTVDGIDFDDEALELIAERAAAGSGYHRDVLALAAREDAAVAEWGWRRGLEPESELEPDLGDMRRRADFVDEGTLARLVGEGRRVAPWAIMAAMTREARIAMARTLKLRPDYRGAKDRTFAPLLKEGSRHKVPERTMRRQIDDIDDRVREAALLAGGRDGWDRHR